AEAGGQLGGCVVGLFCSGGGRHATWPRDWSSDVCSSDLRTEHMFFERDAVTVEEHVLRATEANAFRAEFARAARVGRNVGVGARSEERRVGKEDRRRKSSGYGYDELKESYYYLIHNRLDT